MNEIERFKKRRMIPKAQNGQRFKKVGRSTWGYTIWVDTQTGHFYTGEWDDAYGQDPNRDYGTEKWNKYTDEGTHMTAWHGLLGGHSIEFNGSDYVRRPATPVTPAPTNPTVANGTTKEPQRQAYLAAQAPRQNTGGGARRVTRPKVDYTAKFNGMNFTDDEKRIMTEAGFDPTNAKSVQEFILSKASNANLGARGGSGIADGYWGDKSAAAFQALRNQGIFAPKVDAQEPIKPVSETPVDAPDFGYATNQDYSNGRQFKGLGFNNYQGLLLYAQNSQDQFAKDLRQRFGDRLTDQNYVESQLGISGKYRGGNAGDFGDMARSMQAWKTGVNNEFDKRRADYAQARLAERTGSDGIVYSSPEIMKKFEGIKVSPEVRFGGNKFDFSNMKFNLNFGNTGTNTLGDAGQGSMGNIDNLSPRMKFAMGL